MGHKDIYRGKEYHEFQYYIIFDSLLNKSKASKYHPLFPVQQFLGSSNYKANIMENVCMEMWPNRFRNYFFKKHLNSNLMRTKILLNILFAKNEAQTNRGTNE